MVYENDILTRNDNDELAVRTVQSVGDNPASSYDDVYTRDSNGKLAVRVVGSGGGSGDQHNLGWYATQSALETAHPTAEEGDWAIVGETDTVWVWDSDNDEWKDTDQKGQVESVNGKTGVVVLNASDVGAIPQVSTMPTATATNVGGIVQYVGETGANYTNGYFYKSISDGQDPATYSWTEVSMGGLGVYKDDFELPEATAENVWTAYLVTGYDSETMTPYSPAMYMSVPYILNYIDGEAEVTGYGLTPETQPTDVMIDWATLESFLNSQETGFDWTNDSINISLNGENFLEVMYNADFSASAGVQTDGTVANVQQALEDMGISVDLTEYTDFQFVFLKLPTEKGYENRQVPAFVPGSGPDETDYVLKADGNGGVYWGEAGSGLPDQTGNAGKFLTTDGTDASWSDKPLVNTSTRTNSIVVGGTDSVSGAANIILGNSGVASGTAYRGAAFGMSSKIGKAGTTTFNTVAFGADADAQASYGMAIGGDTVVTGEHAIQLGSTGSTTTNSDANTMKVGNANGNFEIMSADGTIPEARLADTTNAQQGDVLTLDSNGNAVWQAGGGGGGGSTSATATLSEMNWINNSQTVNVQGVTANNNVIVSAAPASQTVYSACGIVCSAQGAGTLTFTCDSVPTTGVTVNVLII